MEINIKDIIDINHTISKDLFTKYNNIWEIIPNIKDYIIKLGNSLDTSKFNKIGNNIWIAKNTYIDENVKLIGPCIIDENTIIRHSAYIRGNTIIGKNCVIGNSSEIKNSIIFDKCQLPHFNYVGDSIIGYSSHLAAGSIITNLKLDKTNIIIRNGKDKVETGLRKFGAVIGNNVDIGANSVIYPGTIIYPNTIIYPLTRVKGIIKSNSIVKDEKTIIRRNNNV